MCRCDSVQLDADAVQADLDRLIEPSLEVILGHVALELPHADRFGIEAAGYVADPG